MFIMNAFSIRFYLLLLDIFMICALVALVGGLL